MPKPYQPNDKWSRRAAEEGFRARSAYKLTELDDRFRLLKKGQTVVDLGAAPGSWLQHIVQKIGPSGVAVGIDLQAIEPIEGVQTVQADITDVERVIAELEKLGVQKADLVLSDLAPRTSGIRDVDQWRSIELSQAVLETSAAILKPSGTCVLKVLRGADFDEFLRECKQQWQSVRTARPKATRDRSTEIYLVLQGKGGT